MKIIYEDGVYLVEQYEKDSKLYIRGRRPYDLQEYSWAVSSPIKNQNGDLLFKVFEYVDIGNFKHKSQLHNICYGYKKAIEIMKKLDCTKHAIIDRT